MKRFFILSFLFFFALSFNVPIVKAQVNPGSALLILFKGAEFLTSGKSDTKGKEINSNPNEMLSKEIKQAVIDDVEDKLKKKLVFLEPYRPIPIEKNWACPYDAQLSKDGITERVVWIISLVYDEKQGKHRLFCNYMKREKYEIFVKLPEEKQKEVIKKQFMNL